MVSRQYPTHGSQFPKQQWNAGEIRWGVFFFFLFLYLIFIFVIIHRSWNCGKLFEMAKLITGRNRNLNVREEGATCTCVTRCLPSGPRDWHLQDGPMCSSNPVWLEMWCYQIDDQLWLEIPRGFPCEERPQLFGPPFETTNTPFFLLCLQRTKFERRNKKSHFFACATKLMDGAQPTSHQANEGQRHSWQTFTSGWPAFRHGLQDPPSLASDAGWLTFTMWSQSRRVLASLHLSQGHKLRQVSIPARPQFLYASSILPVSKPQKSQGYWGLSLHWPYSQWAPESQSHGLQPLCPSHPSCPALVPKPCPLSLPALHPNTTFHTSNSVLNLFKSCQRFPTSSWLMSAGYSPPQPARPTSWPTAVLSAPALQPKASSRFSHTLPCFAPPDTCSRRCSSRNALHPLHPHLHA